ncbi:hypothetical protein CSV77_15645 [Sporosarcina sp. P16b]|uniref:hypothetical protein n=1 Tax=Sporosarcina sp. P16b TaxID=2048261 RepID=UPI000C1685FA|nr:hypothetical protein [Sporosarcina sp. P16b]PIC69057.1 hypothetical protein CSV77_15645 [Sporosarcina sp. P16b]
MAAEARYLKEKQKEWSFFQYHNEKWIRVFEEIDVELKSQNVLVKMSQWEKWSDGFLLFYKNSIAKEVSGKKEGNSILRVRYHSTKETFRTFHLLEQNNKIKEYETEADKLLSSIDFLEKRERVIWKEWLLTGWLPHINFINIPEEKKGNYRAHALRLVIGALYSIMTSNRNHELQMKRIVEISVLMAALEIPSWIWSEFLCRMEGLKARLHTIFSNINVENQPLFKANLNWNKSEMDSYEESIYQKLNSAFENDEILQVARMDIQLSEVRAGLPGWANYLVAIYFVVEPKRIAQLITPEKNPFIFKSICSNPLYQHDLKLLIDLANEAGIWGRIEITKHILILYSDRNNRLSYRLLLLLYLKRCFELLIQMKRPDVLVLLIDQMIPWRMEGEHGNIKWLGSCLGEVLQETASPSLIKEMFGIWKTPYLQDHTLEKILFEIRLCLKEDDKHRCLLSQWDEGIINLWLHPVLQMHFMKDGNSTTIYTYLENAVLPILIERYSNQGNLIEIIEKLTDRWFRIESEWFVEYGMEGKRRNGLLAALLVVVFVAANMDTDRLGKSTRIKEAFENILNIIRDKRNWEVDRESGILRMPPVMDEMRRAIDLI